MSALGSLVVSLGLDTAKFTSDIGKVGVQFERLRDNAVKVGAAIGASLAGAATTTAFLVKQAIDSADEMFKLSQAAGTSVAQFTALAHAADLAGVDVETLSKALSKAGNAADDAARGEGQAAKAFAALGMSAKNADGSLKGQRDVILELAEKMASYRDGTEKTALVTAVFGEKLATRLIPFLNQGAAGIKELEEEAAALGLVLDNETGAAAERFNDNLTRLGRVKDGLVNRIMANLVPSLDALSTELFTSAKNSSLLKETAEAAAAGVRILASAAVGAWAVFRVAGESIATVVSALYLAATGEFKLAWNALSIGAKNNAAIFDETGRQISAIWDRTAKNVASSAGTNSDKLAAPAVQAAGKASKAVDAAAKDAARKAQQIKDAVEGIFNEAATFGMSGSQKKLFDLEQMGASPRDLEEARGLLDILDGMRRAAKQAEDHNDAVEKGKRLYEETRTPAERLNITLAMHNDLLAKGVINWDTYARAVFKANDEFDNASKKVDEGAKRNQSIMKDLGATFTSQAEEAILHWQGFGTLLRGLEQDILRIVTRKAVLEPLFEGIFGTEGSGGGGDFFGSMVGKASSFITGLFGGAAANGSNVTGGQRYLVGENGPEWFTPAQPGVVSQSGGGTPISIRMNVNTPNAESFRRSEGQIGRRMASALSNSARFR